MENLKQNNKHKKIGLMCGTFDPPHNGHLILAQNAMLELGLDLVIFLPVGDPTHKSTRVAVDHRLEMTRLAIADNPAFTLDTTDALRPQPHYTATLLPLIQEKYPESNLWLIIGGDSLHTFPNWYKPAEILEQCRLAVLDRPGVDTEISLSESKNSQFSGKIDRLTGPSIHLSSTWLRQQYAAQSSVRYLVQALVDTYIRDKKLYQK
ncbi:MAG: nicotinate (nicotinamide) nucleotide adenylyltransferase [Anaerolineae bacterium]